MIKIQNCEECGELRITGSVKGKQLCGDCIAKLQNEEPISVCERLSQKFIIETHPTLKNEIELSKLLQRRMKNFMAN